jgi:23S rRNA (cytosine1962-C5)-methyltransferase
LTLPECRRCISTIGVVVHYDPVMATQRAKRKRPVTAEARRVSQRPTTGLLQQRSLRLESNRLLPAVYLRSASYHPFLYRKMIERADASARPGDLVAVHDRKGALFGHGLYNPRSEIVVRMLSHGDVPPDEDFWQQRLEQAVALRRELLRLDQVTDAYRLVHAEADGLSGLVADRLGEVLSAEAFSLGMFQRAEQLLARLTELCGVRHWFVQVERQVHGQEGFLADPLRTPGFPEQVTITEYGTLFRVSFEAGHKTGFFCDQRDNRRRLADFCDGRSVLDLCCYTGGFAIQAKRLGNAADVTGVDLDEHAIALARENARLNQARVQFVHADVFQYMRDMIQNGRQYDVVVLDPPKLIRSRREIDVGTRTHFDLNRLAIQLVRPGGLLLSCCCSGLLSADDFLRLLHAAARQALPHGAPDPSLADARSSGRTIQILAKTGAAADHPVTPNCPEAEYLKAVWLRVV